MTAVLTVLPLTPALAQTATPPKPVFVPGLYQTETRNSAFRGERITRTHCIKAADFDAFQRETITRYLTAPQFRHVCRLSDPRRMADGFAFAMDCGGAQAIVTYRFSKDLVSSDTQTKIVTRPEYSSSILALSRRVGDCPAETDGRGR